MSECREDCNVIRRAGRQTNNRFLVSRLPVSAYGGMERWRLPAADRPRRPVSRPHTAPTRVWWIAAQTPMHPPILHRFILRPTHRYYSNYI